jgi:hypothetical protein
MNSITMTLSDICTQRFAVVNKRGEVVRQGPIPPKTSPPSSGGKSGCLILFGILLFLASALSGLLGGQPPDRVSWKPWMSPAASIEGGDHRPDTAAISLRIRGFQ